MSPIETVCAALNQAGVPYEMIRHPAVFTMEEMEGLSLTEKAHICKNLFLCDNPGKRHFLVVVSGDKRVDLKALSDLLNCKNLRFASEKRLYDYLKLPKGSVTPFGILNDENHQVTLVLDRDILSHDDLGLHPNDNTATVVLSSNSLLCFLERYENPIQYVTL